MGSNLVVVELATAVVLLTRCGVAGARRLYKLLACGTLALKRSSGDDQCRSSGRGLFRKMPRWLLLGANAVRRIEGLPGVESAAITSQLPGDVQLHTTGCASSQALQRDSQRGK